MKRPRTIIELDELRERLREAEETLSAIRNGEVDSLIVSGPAGNQVFSLRGAEQPYRIFVEQMAQGAVTLTPDGTVLFANRRTAEMLGVPLEKVMGSPFTHFLEEADRLPFLQSLATPSQYSFQLNLTTPSRIVPVTLAISSMPIEDTNALCMVITDLTELEQKRDLVKALEKLTTTQEKLSVQNEELRHARKLADAANDAKDEFLATLSHELRTPLTPVLVAAQALENDPNMPGQFHDDLAMMRRNIELEARLIDDLLDLTRIVRGKIELRMTDVNINSVITNVVGICESDLKEANVSLDISLGEKLPPIKGDPVRLQQILWNIVRNAIKFTPTGGQVSVRTWQQGSQLHIEVIDNGIGMSADTLARIFSPFEQAGREITRRFGGLGLGLVISRKLAEMHGGRIQATSQGTRMGSTFSITFPVAASSMTASSPNHQLGGRSNARRLRILLVEDHEDTRRSMVRLLSSDHDVTPADSMASALDRAASHPFELLISDLGLPDGTGQELMRELRNRHGPICGICLSGYGMAEDISSSRDAGFQKHLTKPVSITHLKAAIAEMTQGRVSCSAS